MKPKIAELEHACDGVDMDFLCDELLWGDGPSSILRASTALIRLARAAKEHYRAPTTAAQRELRTAMDAFDWD